MRSKQSTKNWQNPDYRNRVIAAWTPEYRARTSYQMRRYFDEHPEALKKRGEAISKSMLDRYTLSEYLKALIGEKNFEQYMEEAGAVGQVSREIHAVELLRVLVNPTKSSKPEEELLK